MNIRTTRIAIVEPVKDDGELRRIEAYLPRNYQAAYAVVNGTPRVTIYGEDNAGWTLDGYVIPRLASGLIFAKEVEVDA